MIDRGAVLLLHKRGKPRGEIASALCCTPARVGQIIAVALGDRRPPPRPRIDRAEVVRLRTLGATMREIGERLGCTGERVGQILAEDATWLCDIGLRGKCRRPGPRPDQRKHSPETRAAVLALAAEGVTYAEIGARHGMTRYAVRSLLRRTRAEVPA